MKKIILLTSIMISVSLNLFAQKEVTRKEVSFNISLGIVTGNDYSSALKNYLSDYKVSGFLGWFSAGFVADIKLTNQIALCPEVNTLIGRINLALAGFPSTEYDNLIILPGISAKYYLYQKGLSSLFISGGASSTFCLSGFDDFDYKSDGIEKEIYAGFEKTNFITKKKVRVRGKGFGLKIGYIWVPVSVLDNNTNTVQKNDFGGVSLSFYGIF